MEKRNATVAVVGAGDFIGGEIAKKFAAEGFDVFVGRRQGDKLAPLVAEIEAAGGTVFGRSLDARKEDQMVKFLADADAHAPLEVCVFNIGANVNFPIVETTERVFRKVWEMACYSGFLAGREAARLMLRARQGQHLLHRRHGQPARRQGICRLRQRQVRPARGGAVDGPRTRAAEHPCGPSGDRLQRRYRMGAATDRQPRGRRRRSRISIPTA